MKLKQSIVIAAAIALNLGAAGLAQEPASPPPAPVTYAQIRNLHPPVTAGDVTDRPYRVLGEVRASVRKATVFSRAPSQAHVYRELWERAERLQRRRGDQRPLRRFAHHRDELGGAQRHRPGDQVPDRRRNRRAGAARARPGPRGPGARPAARPAIKRTGPVSPEERSGARAG